jgi:hypothetical protein
VAGPDLRGPGRPSCCDGSWSWLVGGCELLTSQIYYEVRFRWTPNRPTWGPKADLAAGTSGRSHCPGPNGPNRRAGISECHCISCVAKGASTAACLDATRTLCGRGGACEPVTRAFAAGSTGNRRWEVRWRADSGQQAPACRSDVSQYFFNHCRALISAPLARSAGISCNPRGWKMAHR